MPTQGMQRTESSTGGWVDDALLAGPGDETCMCLGDVIDRARLRAMVAQRQAELTTAGLVAGGAIAVRLPPSASYVATLLASWKIGAQVTVLDYRLTPHEVDRALERLAPQLVAEPTGEVSGKLRGFFDVEPKITAYPGGAPGTGYSLILLSSGSTGPSKVIARTAESLLREIERYALIDNYPTTGERMVVIASMVHVLGIVGGLLYGLHARVPLTVPERATAAGILDALGADDRPTTLLGVPAQAELLASIAEPPALPHLVGMITGGELVRDSLAERFTGLYGVPLGVMYGMTEVGVIATDILGEHRPSLTPAPGIDVRADSGELLIAATESPYIGLSDPTRWVDGWLRTRDAGSVDPDTGRVTVLGRLDSQVSVGGIKVDLGEVEQVLAGAPGVEHAIVVFDKGIKAYVTSSSAIDRSAIDRVLKTQLASYKRPRAVHILPAMPRTPSGKLVRDAAALRLAAAP